MTTKRVNDGTTHWDGCEEEHHLCAIAKLDAERQRADGLTLQLEASQGALADVIAEHTQSEQEHERVAAQNLADYLALTQREVDGGEEWRARDSQLSRIIDSIRALRPPETGGAE